VELGAGGFVPQTDGPASGFSKDATRKELDMSTAISTHRETPMNELAASGDQAVKTGMLPDHIKTGWQFAVIAATGHELGMQPMRAIRSLAMVKGKVVESADSQLARFKAAGGRSQFEVLDESKAVLHLIHPNGDKHTETFSLEDAKRAGLSSNSNYSKFPKAMLRSRAITAGLKSIGWEGAVGAYDPDELRSEEFPEPTQALRATHPETPAAVDRAHGPAKATQVVAQPPALTVSPAAPPSPVENVRLAVSRASTLDALDTLRKRLDQRLGEGVFSAAQHDELVKLMHYRAEMLIGDSDSEHFDAAEVAAEARA
jgi:hypothetical protein